MQRGKRGIGRRYPFRNKALSCTILYENDLEEGTRMHGVICSLIGRPVQGGREEWRRKGLGLDGLRATNDCTTSNTSFSLRQATMSLVHGADLNFTLFCHVESVE